MSSAERLRCALLRARSAALRAAAAQADLEARLIEAGSAMRRFVDALQSSVDAEVAGHPDLAELNIQLDSFYPTNGATP